MARKKGGNRNSYTTQQERRELRARELFTDRREERRTLARFFEDIIAEDRQPERPIISFYGIGGVGKSTLVSYVWDEFEKNHPDHDAIYINLDVDSDKAEDISAVQLLWNLRTMIFQATESSLLGFDFVYLKYMEKSNEEVSLDDGPVRHFFESMAKRSGVFGSLFRGLGTMIEILPIGNMMSRALRHMQERERERSLMESMGIDLNSIDQWRAGDIERKLPGLLAEDLGMFLVENNRSFILVLDGYERVSKKTERAIVEGFMASLLLDEEYSKRAGVVLLGRERTNWAAYDDPNDDARWNEHFIDHRHLLGLKEEDVHEYIEAGLKLYQREGNAALGFLLKQHATAIQRACRESTGPDGTQFYHPFYLDICLEALETHTNDFDPAKHIGRTPKELMNRFFRYMDEEELSLHITLAMAVEFDWELVSFLQSKNVIPALTHTEFLQFAAAHSYVLNADKIDTFRFNRLIHESLKTYVYTLAHDQKLALRRSVMAALLLYYDELLPGSSRITELGVRTTMRMYSRANMMLMCTAESDLISLDDAYARSQRWAHRYPDDFYQLRLTWNRKWLKMYAMKYGRKSKKIRIPVEGWMDTVEDMLTRARGMLF